MYAIYNYDAFGVVIQATGSVVNSFMYCGYRYDSETEMYYLNARYYHPAIGRFMSADTYVGQRRLSYSFLFRITVSLLPLIFRTPFKDSYMQTGVIIPHFARKDVFGAYRLSGLCYFVTVIYDNSKSLHAKTRKNAFSYTHGIMPFFVIFHNLTSVYLTV